MDRQQAHHLLDELDPSEFDAVAKLLEVFTADAGDEMTAEDRQAVAASREYFRQNPEGGLSLEELASDCGLGIDQLGGRKGK